MLSLFSVNEIGDGRNEAEQLIRSDIRRLKSKVKVFGVVFEVRAEHKRCFNFRNLFINFATELTCRLRSIPAGQICFFFHMPFQLIWKLQKKADESTSSWHQHQLIQQLEKCISCSSCIQSTYIPCAWCFKLCAYWVRSTLLETNIFVTLALVFFFLGRLRRRWNT